MFFKPNSLPIKSLHHFCLGVWGSAWSKNRSIFHDHKRDICHIFMQNLKTLNIGVIFLIYQIFFLFIVFYTCNSINRNGTHLMITPSKRLLIWGSIATLPPRWTKALITLDRGVLVNSKSNDRLMLYYHEKERERVCISVSTSCCLNRFTHLVNRFTMLFLAEILHLPPHSIHTHFLITLKALNHLQIFSLGLKNSLFIHSSRLNTFSYNHFVLWVIRFSRVL